MDSLQKSDGLLTFQDLKGAFIDLCFILTMDKRTKDEVKGVVANRQTIIQQFLNSASFRSLFCFSFTALINPVSSSCFQQRSSKKENPVCTTCSVEQLNSFIYSLFMLPPSGQKILNAALNLKIFFLSLTHTLYDNFLFFLFTNLQNS